ncbi:MAG: flavoprotein [Candidatus Omnitrophica bacterium]|jgi:phosphopantothenoylcysteine decarboxylase/phosphopantothenate--cysteine ligase|nr:flavoprotein [Candidatus Omnitrophota bacterium]MDD5690434.1 flavoprotein [Candidatus Omnitrophota bacterium]
MMVKKGKNIILGVTASIAIYKTCELIRILRKCGFTVKVIMTKEAEELIRPVVFSSLSGNRVYRAGIFDEPDTWEIEHVALAREADLILIAPATANIIAKLATGICDDLLTCTVCASKADILIAPAMNEVMYNNKITQGNIAKLKSCGYKFIAPRKGTLACGNIGVGCLAEVEDIVKEVKNYL